MSIYELILTAIILSIDAFCVSASKGLSSKTWQWKKSLIVGLYFGIFQAFMPLIGYFLGIQFESYIVKIDHWIAFGLLAVIGGKMIIDSITPNEEDNNSSTVFKVMLPLAIATSIDALAAGITFAFLSINIWLAITMIGFITFIFSFIGVKLGNIIGQKFKNKAVFIGGLILVLLGVKILIEHLNLFG